MKHMTTLRLIHKHTHDNTNNTIIISSSIISDSINQQQRLSEVTVFTGYTHSPNKVHLITYINLSHFILTQFRASF